MSLSFRGSRASGCQRSRSPFWDSPRSAPRGYVQRNVTAGSIRAARQAGTAPAHNRAPAAATGHSELRPLRLKPVELRQLEAFLQTLSGSVIVGGHAVEAVVVRHAPTGSLSAVNASAFVAFDASSQSATSAQQERKRTALSLGARIRAAHCVLVGARPRSLLELIAGIVSEVCQKPPETLG